MNNARKEAEAFILKYIEKLQPGNPNVKYYEVMFDNMSDEVFDDYMTQLLAGEEILHFTAPNFEDKGLTVANNLKLSDELGFDFFEQLWVTDRGTGKRYLTPRKYMLLFLVVRRQVQTLEKKVSIPEDNHHIDELSGQPTGPSQGSKISFPELQVLSAQGLDRAIEEFIKFRGGDIEAGRALDQSIIQTGHANLDAILDHPTNVRSTETLSILLKGAHLDNNLA